jgi:ketosteroid isomerase-like protein
MSQENVEVVRRIYESSARHDAETVLSLYDPDLEIESIRVPLTQLIGGDTIRGHEGMRVFFRERAEAWEEIEDECEELIDAGHEVISVVTVRGRGRTSGVVVETRMAGVWTIRDGKVVRVVWLPTRDEALEAVGLRE